MSALFALDCYFLHGQKYDMFRDTYFVLYVKYIQWAIPTYCINFIENSTRLKRDNNVSFLFSGPSQRRNQKKFTSMKPTLKTIVRLQMVL